MAAAMNNIQHVDFNKSKAMFKVKTIRIILMIITSILIVLGLVMVLIGNKTYWHYNIFYDFFFESGELGRYLTPSTLCTFVGLSLITVSVFGLYGSYKKSICFVNSYACILFLLFILKMVTVCMAYFVKRGEIWRQFDIPVWSINDSKIEAEIDFLQSSLRCCGNTHFSDYVDIECPGNMSTVLVPNHKAFLVMPASCCINNKGGYCSHVWRHGCKNALLHTLDRNAVTIRVLVVSVMVFNLLGIIFALLLARCIRIMKNELVQLTMDTNQQVIIAHVMELIKKEAIDQDHYNNKVSLA